MKRRIIFFFLIMIIVFTPYISKAAPTNIDFNLTQIALDGGVDIQLPGFDLTRGGAQFANDTTCYTTFIPLDNVIGCYSFSPKTGRYVSSKEKFPVKPNRNYKISALVYTDFDRNNCEVDIILSSYNKDEKKSHSNRLGIPAQTNGWTRVEKVVTTGAACTEADIQFALYGFGIPDDTNIFYISDLHIIELPETKLIATNPAEGMKFGGSSGKYDMEIKSVTEMEGIVTVKTSGAEFVFDKENDTLTSFQVINKERKVFVATFNKSLAGLSVSSQSTTEAILSTGSGGLTFGVQMDSMVLISNHGDVDLEIECKSEISGKWNRLYQGHIVAKDDFGGFTVNPYIPLGTGRLCRYSADSSVDFDGIYENTEFISSAPSGWTVDYTLTSGELLGMSVFPGRAYDWEESFNSTYINYFRDGNSERFEQDAKNYGVDIGVFWNYTKRAWGMAYSDKYELVDNYKTKFENDILLAHQNGIKVAPYMSMYFWHNRDIDEYIADVKRYRDNYGIDGIYSDGTPDIEWLTAYEGVRKLRELFPDGPLIVHQTGKHGNGGPPSGMPDIFIPSIDSYLTMTLRGEDIAGDGIAWPYLKDVVAGYNSSNTIGILKGNAWTENGEEIPHYKQSLINLLYNGRSRVESRDEDKPIKYASVYNDILEELERNYKLYRKNDDYFNEHYLPKLHSLIRDDVHYGNEIEDYFGTKTLFSNDFTKASHLSQWDKTEGENSNIQIAELEGRSFLLIDDGNSRTSKAELKRSFEKQTGKVELRLSVITDSDGNGHAYLSDENGIRCLGVYVGNGEIRVLGTSGAYRIVGTSEPDTEYFFSIVADCGNKRFSVSCNDSILVRNMHFHHRAGVPASLTLSTGDMGGGKAYFTDVELLNAF